MCCAFGIVNTSKETVPWMLKVRNKQVVTHCWGKCLLLCIMNTVPKVVDGVRIATTRAADVQRRKQSKKQVNFSSRSDDETAILRCLLVVARVKKCVQR